jgi:hypothetical protein
LTFNRHRSNIHENGNTGAAMGKPNGEDKRGRSWKTYLVAMVPLAIPALWFVNLIVLDERFVSHREFRVQQAIDLDASIHLLESLIADRGRLGEDTTTLELHLQQAERRREQLYNGGIN